MTHHLLFLSVVIHSEAIAILGKLRYIEYRYFLSLRMLMNLRSSNIQRLKRPDFVYDALVIGGGINGAVSAAALSAKGASVALIDRGDFAGLTSSNSSNLAWGGIKYLESHEYFLVNNLCKNNLGAYAVTPRFALDQRTAPDLGLGE